MEKNSEQILRLPAVLVRVGLSRSTLYRFVNKRHFPKPVKLGQGETCAVGWLASEVDAWVHARQAERGVI